MRVLWRGTEKVVDIFAVACSVACLVNMVLLFVNIVLRYAFKTSLPGATEYATVILMFVAYFGLAYTHRENRHMQMGALYQKYGPKMKKAMDIVIYCIILFLFAMMIYAAWEGFLKSVQTMEVMQASVPVYRWPGRLAILLGCILFFFRTVLEMICSIARIDVKKAPAKEEMEGTEQISDSVSQTEEIDAQTGKLEAQADEIKTQTENKEVQPVENGGGEEKL